MKKKCHFDDSQIIFTKCIRCPPLTKAKKVTTVLDHLCNANPQPVFTREQVDEIAQKIAGSNVGIGIKKLMQVIKKASKTPADKRVAQFILDASTFRPVNSRVVEPSSNSMRNLLDSMNEGNFERIVPKYIVTPR